MSDAEFMDIIKNVLRLKKIGMDDRLGRTRGWDSLGHIELLTVLEEKFNLAIPIEMIGDLTSVQSLLTYFASRGVLS